METEDYDPTITRVRVRKRRGELRVRHPLRVDAIASAELEELGELATGEEIELGEHVTCRKINETFAEIVHPRGSRVECPGSRSWA